MPSTEQRSQPILRLPKNQTPALLVMHDGQREQVFLFVAPGEPLARVLDDTSAFLPMGCATGTRLVARASIAAVGVHTMYAGSDEDLPGERQAARIRLRSGAILQGEIRWIAPEGRRRLLDLLNGDDSAYVVLHDVDQVLYVAKAHVAAVEEV